MASRDEFVERAPCQPRCSTSPWYSVQEARGLLRLQTFRGAGEVLNVREKDRELLAFSLDSYLLLAAENARIDLRCEIARDIPCYVGRYFVGTFESAVHTLDCPDEPPLNDYKAKSQHRHEGEVAQQILEGENVGCH
jgi:hypothetical protein